VLSRSGFIIRNVHFGLNIYCGGRYVREILALAVIMHLIYMAFLKNNKYQILMPEKPLCLHLAFDEMCKHESWRWIKLDFQT